MTNGQKLSGTTMGLYSSSTGSNNPRVVFGKAEFEIEQRSFGNRYKTHVCPNKAIGLLLL
jgi:hypothetical protein